MSDLETFVIDSELARDAIYAGIWNRLCHEIRGLKAEGRHLNEYIEYLAVARGDSTELLRYLEEDTGCLTTALRQLRSVEAAALGSAVDVNDVWRFMPVAWKSEAASEPRMWIYATSEPGRWIYTESETEEAELLAPDTIVRVRPERGATTRADWY